MNGSRKADDHLLSRYGAFSPPDPVVDDVKMITQYPARCDIWRSIESSWARGDPRVLVIEGEGGDYIGRMTWRSTSLIIRIDVSMDEAMEGRRLGSPGARWS